MNCPRCITPPSEGCEDPNCPDPGAAHEPVVGLPPIPRLNDLEGIVRASAPKSIMMLEAGYVLQMIERIRQADALLAEARPLCPIR